MTSFWNRLAGNRPAQFGLLAVVACAVYALTLGNGFAYDDVAIIRNDPRVTQFQFNRIFTEPYWTSPGFALYRPLVTLSFAVDWAAANGSAAWFHGMNAIWHALATVMLFALLLAWFTVGPALLAALLFALHPVHVEAVANVVGRAELMAAAFFLAACAVWAHAWPRRRAARAGIVAGLYLLAILCKESAATLPAILLLIDVAKADGSSARPLRRITASLRSRLPEYAVLAVILTGAVALRTVLAGSATPTQLDPVMEITGSGGDRIRTALQIWPHVMRLLLFPGTLLADYGPRVLMPADGWTPLALLGLSITLILVPGGLLLLDRGKALPALALLWLPVTLLPVANLLFPIGILLAERTLYLPSVAVSLGLALVAQRTAALGTAVSVRRAAAAACAVIAVLCTVRIQTRIPDWDSTDSIMMAQRRDRPDSFRAEWHAARMTRRTAHAETIRRYQQALQLWPYRQRLVLEAAAYMSDQRDFAGALRVTRFGVQRWPRSLELQRLRAANALDAGDTATARAAMLAGLQLAPTDSLLQRMSKVLSPRKALQ